MDKFITLCLKDGKLIHKVWIQARLIEAIMILGASKDRNILRLVTKLEALQRLIMLGDGEDDRVKDSGGNRPARRGEEL